MSPKVQETAGRITFFEKVPNGARIFITLVGLIPIFLAPYELLIRPRWNGFGIVLAFSILISIGAILIGGLFVAIGLLGLNQTLAFDSASRSIYYSYESALIPLRRKTYKFSDITKISVSVHDWSDSPTTYSLQVLLTNGQKIGIGNFENRNEAEQSLAKVESLIW
jgi:hypothetical protein